VAVAAPAGIALYMAFLWIRFGDPLLFVHTQLTHWRHEAWPVWRTLGEALRRLAAGGSGVLGFELAAWAGMAVLTLLATRRAPFAFTLYMAGLLYASIASPVPAEPDLISSAGRYLTAALPAFLFLGLQSRGRPALDLLLMSGGFLLQAIFLVSFLQGGAIH
jgi:hypothetical protein